ncbi:glycosyltransferase family 4 protein [Spirosoma taeanense]|uniref:Glycosyltransferase family 4 protein n=1 Tax=Spirosoma taeanense TaxID=2735870 RepID=A0A6M5YB00_9BACT|nr:glycosyltransferase family 4 protein [Spirosoma taeanense]QJW91165.1 glycosyltransferase family 4 protein [Spirosoma taeanense]
MNILYLTFYFEPDLCAGSFRNTPLVSELAEQLSAADTLHVVTTQPNRYQSFKVAAPGHEERLADSGCRVIIDRVVIPTHASGLADQIRSFLTYYRAAHRLTRGQQYDLVVASSSRLFTAFLGARFARRQRKPLFLDIRDLFRETILEVLKNPVLRLGLNPVLWAVETYTFGYARHINLVSEGFRSYFSRFSQATYTYFTNGIDDEFLDFPVSGPAAAAEPKTLLYAGNIGEGQGLHKIIPQAARQLGNGFRFVVIGDGGAKARLEAAIQAEGVQNVELRKPVGRKELIAQYQKADYLFVHLNDLDAFRRVLPSKLFEYGATDKPVVAGVTGYAAQFVRDHLDNRILFNPGEVDSLVSQLRALPYRTGYRTDFVARFQRKTIMGAMARQIQTTVAERADAPEPATV